MPENPRLSSLGMNGILSKLRQVEPGGVEFVFRQCLAWSKVMPGMPAGLKPRSLDRGVGSFDPKETQKMTGRTGRNILKRQGTERFMKASVKTGGVQGMKGSYDEGRASHLGPESCGGAVNRLAEALTGWGAMN
jgi:hypothetical protein